MVFLKNGFTAFLALPLFLSIAAFADFKLEYTSKSQALDSFFSQIDSLIPPAVKKTINRKVKIEFESFSPEFTELPLPPCDWQNAKVKKKQKIDIPNSVNKIIHGGLTKSGTIKINELFLKEIEAGPFNTRTFACGHKNVYRLALATVLHEIGHLYDNSFSTKASESKWFKNLTKWKKNFLFFWMDEKNKNRSSNRVADPFENLNPAEAFAIHLEYFLLDPEYECRMPSRFAYYHKLLEYRAFPEGSCKFQVSVPVYDRVAGTVRQVELDPKRVYDVHYLLAAKGHESESSYGHAMYRLILCSPEREKVGPECLDDLPFQVVASYRANVEDIKLSKVKGLFGGYDSKVFLFTLPSILQEYNKEEMRDLISFPVKRPREDKENFVYRVIEDFWSYAGDYKFITNNCATESRDLLRTASFDEKTEDLSSITPIDLMVELSKKDLIENILLPILTGNPKSVEEARNKTYFFLSKKPMIEQAYDEIYKAAEKYKDDLIKLDINGYVYSTDAKKRMELYKTLIQKIPHSESQEDKALRHLLASDFYTLENQIRIMSIATMRKQLMVYFFQLEEKKQDQADSSFFAPFWDFLTFGGSDSKIKAEDQMPEELRGALAGLIEKQKKISDPSYYLKSGYGIPLLADFIDDKIPTESEDLSKQGEQVLKQFKGFRPEIFREPIAILKNMLSFLEDAQKTQINGDDDTRKTHSLF